VGNAWLNQQFQKLQGADCLGIFPNLKFEEIIRANEFLEDGFSSKEKVTFVM
jgi:hypothetical protein